MKNLGRGPSVKKSKILEKSIFLTFSESGSQNDRRVALIIPSVLGLYIRFIFGVSIVFSDFTKIASFCRNSIKMCSSTLCSCPLQVFLMTSVPCDMWLHGALAHTALQF